MHWKPVHLCSGYYKQKFENKIAHRIEVPTLLNQCNQFLRIEEAPVGRLQLVVTCTCYRDFPCLHDGPFFSTSNPTSFTIMATEGSGDASATPGSFNIPLRPFLEKHDHPDKLPVEIAQINAQWGSFRDVNEESLQEKIREEREKGDALDEDESEKPAGEVDSTERLEQLYKRRAEITQFALYGYPLLTDRSIGGRIAK